MTEEGRSGKNEANQRSDIEIANELINFANDKQEAGIHPTVIAAAFRHAAANFTAFAYADDTNKPLATERIMEDFLQALEFYDEQHRGKAPPMTSLEKLVKQVKSE
tara:strand:+ start:199 stop:516 length:318 start_codon:yes stop_codon:yes gene_type:complete